MRILHYSLGFPPYRSGGLTKFCLDLMIQQNYDGHQVALLWPGQMRFINKSVSIKYRNIYKVSGISAEIKSYELINPLPISYDEGINRVEDFMIEEKGDAYERLLEDFRPNIIHIHTLMGLHNSLLLIAKRKGIRLIFTAHDFFPICPKVILFHSGHVCESSKYCIECSKCNSTALNYKKIVILQSPLYRRFKDLYIIKRLRKHHRTQYLSEKSDYHRKLNTNANTDNYQKLRSYYYSILQLMDSIHYNSTLTKNIYESFFTLPKSKVITISHANITDNRVIKEFSKDKLKIRYLGPQSAAKGYYLLKSALDKLWDEKKNFQLDIHFTPENISPYMKVHGRYSYQDLQYIFKHTDVLVVPSLCFETFGYTALEALCFGVPVILSENVGAKDILSEDEGVIIKDINVDKLYLALLCLTEKKLKAMNIAIIEKQKINILTDMTTEIMNRCYCSE